MQRPCVCVFDRWFFSYRLLSFHGKMVFILLFLFLSFFLSFIRLRLIGKFVLRYGTEESSPLYITLCIPFRLPTNAAPAVCAPPPPEEEPADEAPGPGAGAGGNWAGMPGGA